jgi:hypothetical protein
MLLIMLWCVDGVPVRVRRRCEVPVFALLQAESGDAAISELADQNKLFLMPSRPGVPSIWSKFAMFEQVCCLFPARCMPACLRSLHACPRVLFTCSSMTRWC